MRIIYVCSIHSKGTGGKSSLTGQPSTINSDTTTRCHSIHDGHSPINEQRFRFICRIDLLFGKAHLDKASPMIRTAKIYKMDIVKINVGGRVFLTHRRTVNKLPRSTLAIAVGNADYYENSLDMFFFDRRPGLFEAILEAHRDGEIHFPSAACGSEMVAELEFWNLPISMVASCCIAKVRNIWLFITEEESSHHFSQEMGLFLSF
jgi:sialic acid synthase SpsE